MRSLQTEARPSIRLIIAATMSFSPTQSGVWWWAGIFQRVVHTRRADQSSWQNFRRRRDLGAQQPPKAPRLLRRSVAFGMQRWTWRQWPPTLSLRAVRLEMY